MLDSFSPPQCTGRRPPLQFAAIQRTDRERQKQPQPTDYITQSTLHSVHYTVFITQCTLHSVHYTVYITQCTLHSVHYTVYITQCTLHSVHYTVANFQCNIPLRATHYCLLQALQTPIDNH